MLSKTTLSLFLYRCSATPRGRPSSSPACLAVAPSHPSSAESLPTTTNVGVFGLATGAANLSLEIFFVSSFRLLTLLAEECSPPEAITPRGLATCPIVKALGELALLELGLLIGMISRVCSRETEICLAIEISAAVLSFFSRSSASSSRLRPPSSARAGPETGFELRPIVFALVGADVVVRLRNRLEGGGECIGGLWRVDALRDVVAVLPDAVIETEYPRVRDGRGDSDPGIERDTVGSRGDVTICRAGSMVFGLLRKGSRPRPASTFAVAV